MFKFVMLFVKSVQTLHTSLGFLGLKRNILNGFKIKLYCRPVTQVSYQAWVFPYLLFLNNFVLINLFTLTQSISLVIVSLDLPES